MNAADEERERRLKQQRAFLAAENERMDRADKQVEIVSREETKRHRGERELGEAKSEAEKFIKGNPNADLPRDLKRRLQAARKIVARVGEREQVGPDISIEKAKSRRYAKSDAERTVRGRTDNVKPFPSVSLAEIMASALRDPLRRVAGLIGEGDYLTLVYGPSTAGKTFLAIDLVVAVLLGLTWFGRRTLSCGVLYIAREGEVGFFNRIKARCRSLDVDVDALPFRAITAPVNLGPADADQHVEKVIATIEQTNAEHDTQPVGLVIYDNMRAVAPGMHENYSEEIEALFAKTRTIARATGGSPIILDNTGKDTERGARGTQAKFDLADTVIEAEQNGSRAWKVQKVRDGIAGERYGFRFEDVPLGTVEGIDGEPKTIKSAIVLPEDAPSQRQQLSDAIKDGLKILDYLLGAEGVEQAPLGANSKLVRVVEKARFRVLFMERRGDLDTKAARRQAFGRFLKDGRKKGVINTKALADDRVLIWRP